MNKTAILTTVCNFKLYETTAVYFPADMKRYVVDGTNGMHGINSIFYMMKKLKNSGIKWLIMADEDVIFKDNTVVQSIINQMEQEDYTVCGVRDGGVINHRKFNPFVINTFFSVLNLAAVYEIWNTKDIGKHQYILDNEFPDDLSGLKYDYDPKSLYEPYYCFYFWLRRNGKKILFLDSKMEEDGITNAVLYQDNIILHHTWHARSYGVSEKHTQRINKFLATTEGFNKKNNLDNTIVFKSSTFYWKRKMQKAYRKVVQKIKKYADPS